jgi:quinol monooxygenase YgiN
MSASSPLTIVAIATALPGQEKTLRAAQEKLVADTAKEPGCLRYELHQSLEDGRVLVSIESWENEEKWRAHMQGAAIKCFHASGAGNLIQDFSLIRMNLIADGARAIINGSSAAS